MGKQVAVITGATRGIGYETARLLLKKFRGDVIVTGRNTANGKRACQRLTGEGLKPVWHEVDVTQSASIRMFIEFIKENYGGIDILINNAGTIFPKECSLSMFRQAELTINTNFKGTVSLCRYLFPLLRPQSRVIIMSSELGKLSSLGQKLRQQIDIETVSMFELDGLADKYLAAVRAKVWSEYGWPDRILEAVSVLQNILVKCLARDLKKDERRNILVNACCPGWTATDDMKTHLDSNGCLGDIKARTAEDSACDVVELALLPSGTTSPNGEVVFKGKSVSLI